MIRSALLLRCRSWKEKLEDGLVKKVLNAIFPIYQYSLDFTYDSTICAYPRLLAAGRKVMTILTDTGIVVITAVFFPSFFASFLCEFLTGYTVNERLRRRLLHIFQSVRLLHLV